MKTANNKMVLTVIILFTFLFCFALSCGGGGSKKNTQKDNDNNNGNNNYNTTGQNDDQSNDTTSTDDDVYDTSSGGNYDTTSGDDGTFDTTHTDDGFDTSVIPAYDTTKASRAIIGSDGGKLFSRDGKFILEFSPGTLDKNEEIVILSKDINTMPKQFTAIKPDNGYDLFPKELKLNKPVKVTFKLSEAVRITDSSFTIGIPLPAMSGGDKIVWFESCQIKVKDPIRLPIIKKLSRKLREPESYSGEVTGQMPDWANKSGGVGIGGTTTLGGTNGINIRTYVTPFMGIEMNFGFNLANVPPDPDEDISGTIEIIPAATFNQGIYGIYKLAYWQRGSISGILGFDYSALSTINDLPDNSSDASQIDISIKLGLPGEYFPTQYLSLYANAGIAIDFISQDDFFSDGVFRTGPNAEAPIVMTGNSEINNSSGANISLSGNLWGSAGFTVWFNRKNPQKSEPKGLFNLDPNRLYVAVANANGVLIHDILTGEVALNIFSPYSYMYGALFMHLPEYTNNFGKTSSDCFIGYGQIGSNTSFWYDTSFGMIVGSFGYWISDAWLPSYKTSSYDMNYGIVTHSNSGGGNVSWYKYNTTAAYWEKRTSLYSSWYSSDKINTAVSAQEGFDSFALVLTQGDLYAQPPVPGELWYGNINSQKGTKVGSVGNSSRRLRCVNGLCFVTNYASNTLSVIKWPNSSQKPDILYNVPVGNGPVGIHLGIDKDSTIHILTTGFNDNTYTITQVEPDGTLKSNKTTTLTNCNNPGHASFITKNKILITSYTDSIYVIVTRPKE